MQPTLGHYRPLYNDGRFITLKKTETRVDILILVFANQIWRLYRIPSDIVSDRDSGFISKFGKAFLTTMGVKPEMLIVFYLETNGQSEGGN
jgi:hypothetical protein